MPCRICLTDVTPLIGIFSEDGIKHQLADKIRMCLQIQVKKDDCFPDKLCCKCFMSVNEFFSFWKKAKESNNLLQNLQKNVTSKQTVSWPGAYSESEDVVIEPTPDLLDMIDMEIITEKRQIVDFLKQAKDEEYKDNSTGKTKSACLLLPADGGEKDNSSSNMMESDATSTDVQDCNTMQSIQDPLGWKHSHEERQFDSKPIQFISKHFSFGRPSMTYDQQNLTNSWGMFNGGSSESQPHKAEKEQENSKDVNSPFEHKAHIHGCSQPIFSSNDEHTLPNIPLSLFSSSDDKKQTENLQPQSPILGTSKENVFSQKSNIEMTPRSKVMKMLKREIW